MKTLPSKTFRVHFTNFGYYSQQEGETLEEAKAIGKKAGFEFSVVSPEGEVAASWSVFDGFRRMNIGVAVGESHDK